MRARALLAAAALASAGTGAQVIALLSPFDDRSAWRFVGVPKQPPTRFETVALDGADALRVAADASYGNLVHGFTAPQPATLALRWQWRVDVPNLAADLRRRDGDDTTLKVCALFDLPLDRVPFVERQLLRLARAWSGEALPAATVCYVWDAMSAAGTRLDNAWSRRVRYIVARGADAPLQRWLDERHDLGADFLHLFGDESAAPPPLVALAIGADADNTRSRSVGFIRALRWADAPP